VKVGSSNDGRGGCSSGEFDEHGGKSRKKYPDPLLSKLS
jgi:hypothetical protein